MKRSFWVAIAIVVLFSVQACNDTRKAKNYNDKTLVDDTGVALLKDGSESGNAEVVLSKLAQKQSQNPKIVNFAKMMVTDHTQLGNDLKKLAEDKKVTISDTLNNTHKQLVTSLSAKTGAEFDKEYIQAMVTDHEKAVSVFQSAAHNTNKGINNFAKKTLPQLEDHLKAAQNICASLK